jgi:hypothetical protein
MKSFLSIKIALIFSVVALTNTTKAQTACGSSGIVLACGTITCDYFTGNGYTFNMCAQRFWFEHLSQSCV